MSEIRTRFAPAPSGVIHLGNIRTALICAIFAKKNGGRFFLRVEDTDKNKVTPESIKTLFQDLRWLGIEYDEGPEKPGDLGPYFQSKRHDIYQAAFEKLKKDKKVYRCFCTKERLAQLRKTQMTQRVAPRYDRHCLNLPEDILNKYQEEGLPFVWRFLVDHNESITIYDEIRSEIKFEMKNFTDFVICRSDGTFNFLFANFVDDVEMKTTHIIRGEDHLSNGPLQGVLYKAFNLELPRFIHLQLILDSAGQKLSKRSSNFDLHSLREQGFLPEAICSYLVSLGSNLEEQACSFEEMVENYKISSLSTQAVKYEVPKMLAMNKKWLVRLSSTELLEKMKAGGFLKSKEVPSTKVIETLKKTVDTLKELGEQATALQDGVMFEQRHIEAAKKFYSSKNQELLEEFTNLNPAEISPKKLNDLVEKYETGKREVFTIIRLACSGNTQGLSINELFELFDETEIINRIRDLIKLI